MGAGNIIDSLRPNLKTLRMLPLYLFGQDVAICGVGGIERIGLVLYAQHYQRLCSRIAYRTLNGGSNSYDGSLFDGENLSICLILALTLYEEIYLLVLLVGMQKTCLRADGKTL